MVIYNEKGNRSYSTVTRIFTTYCRKGEENHSDAWVCRIGEENFEKQDQELIKWEKIIGERVYFRFGYGIEPI